MTTLSLASLVQLGGLVDKVICNNDDVNTRKICQVLGGKITLLHFVQNTSNLSLCFLMKPDAARSSNPSM